MLLLLLGGEAGDQGRNNKNRKMGSKSKRTKMVEIVKEKTSQDKQVLWMTNVASIIMKKQEQLLEQQEFYSHVLVASDNSTLTSQALWRLRPAISTPYNDEVQIFLAIDDVNGGQVWNDGRKNNRPDPP
jgi:hypothetical protein